MGNFVRTAIVDKKMLMLYEKRNKGIWGRTGFDVGKRITTATRQNMEADVNKTCIVIIAEDNSLTRFIRASLEGVSEITFVEGSGSLTAQA